MFAVIAAPLARRSAAVRSLLKSSSAARRALLGAWSPVTTTAPTLISSARRASASAVVDRGGPAPITSHTKRTPLFVDWDAPIFNRWSPPQNGVAQYIRDYETTSTPTASRRQWQPALRVVDPGLNITTGKDAALAKCPPTCIAPSPSCAARRARPLCVVDRGRIVRHRVLAARTLQTHPAPAGSRIGRANRFHHRRARASRRRRIAWRQIAHVIADLNVSGAETVAAEIVKKHGAKRGLAVACDVTNEEQVAAASGRPSDLRRWTGGKQRRPAASAPITKPAPRDRIYDVLATGYFSSRAKHSRYGRRKGRAAV